MESIGIIGEASHCDMWGDRYKIFHFDPARPLELRCLSPEKQSCFTDVPGYFHPISEMVKMVDGPIFVCLSADEADIQTILWQIEEAVPTQSFPPRRRPKVYVQADFATRTESNQLLIP